MFINLLRDDVEAVLYRNNNERIFFFFEVFDSYDLILQVFRQVLFSNLLPEKLSPAQRKKG